MDNETMLREILHAFKLYTEHIDKRFDEFDKQIDEMFNRFNHKDNHFEKLKIKMTELV